MGCMTGNGVYKILRMVVLMTGLTIVRMVIVMIKMTIVRMAIIKIVKLGRA